MQFNFFSWMREGVKQAILLGVSDAVEEIGLPPDGDEIGKRLQRALKHETPTGNAALPGPGNTPEGGKRKRLGRSLRDLDGAEAAPTASPAGAASEA
jgi:hypothetical protein